LGIAPIYTPFYLVQANCFTDYHRSSDDNALVIILVRQESPSHEHFLTNLPLSRDHGRLYYRTDPQRSDRVSAAL